MYAFGIGSYFTQHNSLEIHPGGSVGQWFFLFLLVTEFL